MSARWSVLALATLLPAVAQAQPVCTTPARLMEWPTGSPVWKFCFLTPVQSSGPNGSGLELRDVYYNDHLVLKRAHAPILNVKYLPGGCGGGSLCYRDWSDQEVRFRVITASGPASSGPGGYAEAVVPPETICDVGGSSGDVGNFNGVAAEKLSDRLILTTQTQAGWYRYNMRWRLHLDGRIEGSFGFAAVPNSCVSRDHTHHNYWRMDFDIDGAAADSVQSAPPADHPPAGKPIGAENKYVNEGGRTWLVKDLGTGRGYRVIPGKGAPVDVFAVSDDWFLQYKPSEIDDSGQPGPACAIKFQNFLNQESVDAQDVVVWVRGGQFHGGGDADDCSISEFMAVPVGNWAP